MSMNGSRRDEIFAVPNQVQIDAHGGRIWAGNEEGHGATSKLAATGCNAIS